MGTHRNASHTSRSFNSPRTATDVNFSCSLVVVLLLLVTRWRFHLVDPIPLTSGDLDCHHTGNRLLKAVDGGEGWDDEPQDDDRWDVEEQILGLHQQLMVAPNAKTL